MTLYILLCYLLSVINGSMKELFQQTSRECELESKPQMEQPSTTSGKSYLYQICLPAAIMKSLHEC